MREHFDILARIDLNKEGDEGVIVEFNGQEFEICDFTAAEALGEAIFEEAALVRTEVNKEGEANEAEEVAIARSATQDLIDVAIAQHGLKYHM
ncbi:hypothetical protein LCGC14_1435970 [marine sediment metagenome]|uniref:Uncharacterized protein n=1 Tax=marine sediment metagenome TaxID=412755 RepID=A0A0F9M2P7_9ZZZZ